ncbi:MAG: diacylglycerol kinase family lipid kinase [Lachnospiraceae bacterium]|nr:diacylglycerol kinase family lipid kinase [Lachnospiraceae bacterium]
MEENKKLVFIMNPKAGQKKREDILPDIINTFYEYGYDTEIHFTRFQGDATKMVGRHCRNCDLIVCMGGDGTLNEVIEGIIEAGVATPLGYIPAGSTNDFASSLNLSNVPATAAKNIVTGKAKTIDIGRFNNRYFVYTASAGIFTRTSYETPQNAKNLLGHFAYILEGAKDLTNVKPLRLSIEYDDKKIEGEYIFAAICNSTSIGGIMTIDKERVDFTDGLFEMLLIKFPRDIIEMGILINKLQTQSYGDGVELIPISKALIRDEAASDWSLDGEKENGRKDTVFEVFHHAVHLIY